jgi:hypothetical protein
MTSIAWADPAEQLEASQQHWQAGHQPEHR